jgi:hypothetical protein
MAGKRQHYVPKFLQRGFLTHDRTEADGECTWWHFRGNPPKPLAISHIGVEEHFYSRLRKDGVPTLDDAITDRESGIQTDLTHTLQAPIGTPLDPVLMGRLVAHFVLRTAFIRSVFSNAARQMVDEVIASIGTARGARAHMGVDDPNVSPQMAGIVAEVRAKLEAAGAEIPSRLAERLLAYALREQFDAFMAEVEPLLARVQMELMQGLPTSIASAHQRTLAEGNHAAWESALARLSWRVHAADGVVLPDCIAIAQSQGKDWAPLLLAGLEELETCLFPLSEGRVLVGTMNPALLLDMDAANAACAGCSDQFFIAARPMPMLATRLGGRSAEVIKTQIEDALRDLRSSATPALNQAPPIEAAEPGESGQFSYVLRLPAFDDPAHSTALHQIVAAIVRELSHTLPLESLDGITFAVEYAAAIAALDRGDPTLTPDLSVPRTYGVPVAKCIAVAREGRRKQHLVFGWPIVEGFLSEDLADQHASLHNLTAMLAHVAHDVRYEQPLAITAPPFPNDFTSWIHSAAAAAPGQYFAARVAAFADATAGSRYAQLFRDCVRIATEAMIAAHQAYGDSGSDPGDVGALLNAGLHHTGNLMSHAAQWCGHQDGLILSASGEGDAQSCGADLMRETLVSLNLEPWLELLHRDIRHLYDEPNAFTAERHFALTRHVERLLWQFQVCPWPTNDGGTYVTIVTSGIASFQPPV